MKRFFCQIQHNFKLLRVNGKLSPYSIPRKNFFYNKRDKIFFSVIHLMRAAVRNGTLMSMTKRDRTHCKPGLPESSLQIIERWN